MPRSTMASRRALLFDKALELRDYAAPAIAASTEEEAIAFPATKQLGYKAVVDSAPFSGYLAGTAQWEIIIEAAQLFTGTYSEVARVVPDGTQKRYEVPLSGEWVEDIMPEALFVRARAIKTGTPGNLTYGAFLTC